MKSSFSRTSLPLLLWTAAMLAVSSTPGDKLPELPGPWFFLEWDKVAHLLEYAVFGSLFVRYLTVRRGLARTRAGAIGVAVGWAYGALDELHQIFIPLRACDWRDWVMDATGVLAGAVLLACLRGRRPACPC